MRLPSTLMTVALGFILIWEISNDVLLSPSLILTATFLPVASARALTLPSKVQGMVMMPSAGRS